MAAIEDQATPGAGADHLAPSDQAVETDLIRLYMALRVNYLQRKLDALDRREREEQQRQQNDADRLRLWGGLVTPIIVVLTASATFTISAIGVWDPFAKNAIGDGGASSGDFLGRAGSWLETAIRDWGPLVLPLGAAIALVFKRMANRSFFSIVVVLLSGLYAVSLAGIELVLQKDWFAHEHLKLLNWHSWSLIVPATVVSLLILHLLTQPEVRNSVKSPANAWVGWLVARVPPVFRRPAGARSMAWFALAGFTSLVTLLAAQTAFGGGPSVVDTVFALLFALGLIAFAWWLAWAFVASPLALRLSFVPVGLVAVATFFIPTPTIPLPFVTLLVVLSIGIPIELRRCETYSESTSLTPRSNEA